MQEKTNIDLAQVFKVVSKVMVQNQASLNEADSYNHDHGDNMVEIFKLVSKVMEANKNATPSEQLTQAAQQLESQCHSGSAKVYAEGFSRAAQQFAGQQTITPDNLMLLVQLLMGASQNVQNSSTTPSTPDNPLGSLLGSLGASLLGQSQQTTQNPSNTSIGGIGLDNILSAGMAFLQSQQQGESAIESIIDAVVAGSQMGSSQDRALSAKLLANTIMQVASSVGKK